MTHHSQPMTRQTHEKQNYVGCCWLLQRFTAFRSFWPLLLLLLAPDQQRHNELPVLKLDHPMLPPTLHWRSLNRPSVHTQFVSFFTCHTVLCHINYGARRSTCLLHTFRLLRWALFTVFPSLLLYITEKPWRFQFHNRAHFLSGRSSYLYWVCATSSPLL